MIFCLIHLIHTTRLFSFVPTVHFSLLFLKMHATKMQKQILLLSDILIFFLAVLTCVIILMSVAVTSVTALSISAIATNGRVFGGESFWSVRNQISEIKMRTKKIQFGSCKERSDNSLANQFGPLIHVI